MARITELMIRKRAEHNNMEIFTLEELSLHQQDITQIELVDKVCRDLKILYLQSNLIGKIENIQRLKKLEYLNLALNNIKRVENLEGCESLNKLDLTVNFVSEVTSIESLSGNYNLRELFLTGNPCTQFDGYRQFVAATLPQLKTLDGEDIGISERIQAQQEMSLGLRRRIVQQQVRYAMEEEQREREEAEEEEEEDDEEIPGETEEEREKRYWSKQSRYTPKSRIETQEHLRKSRADRDNAGEEKKKKRAPRRFERDGRMLNINDGKYPFSIDDSTQPDKVILDLTLPRFLDLSLIDCDIQPAYVRVIAKGKVFQLVLPEEVQSESSAAQRSKVTGNLVITMPKVRQVPVLKTTSRSEARSHPPSAAQTSSRIDAASGKSTAPQRLEVEPGKKLDLRNIVSSSSASSGNGTTLLPSGARVQPGRSLVQELDGDGTGDDQEEGCSSDFEDDPDVPPLM